jgi:hypothetical protein
MYILLKTLLFPFDEPLWIMEPGFQCGREEKTGLFFALGASAFFTLFILRALALFVLLRAHESEKNLALGPPWRLTQLKVDSMKR